MRATLFFLPVAALSLACAGGAPPDAGPPAASRVRITKAGDGRGIVRSVPDGILCDVECAEAAAAFPTAVPGAVDGAGAIVDEGGGAPATFVTLVAEPARDAQFDGWFCASQGASLAREDETRETTVRVLATTEGEDVIESTCTARFLRVVTLQIVRTGGGSGVVRGRLAADPATPDVPRVDCGADCVGAYFADEVETLTATPDPGSTFSGWRLDCGGTDAIVDVTMDDRKTCEAVFDAL